MQVSVASATILHHRMNKVSKCYVLASLDNTCKRIGVSELFTSQPAVHIKFPLWLWGILPDGDTIDFIPSLGAVFVCSLRMVEDRLLVNLRTAFH